MAVIERTKAEANNNDRLTYGDVAAMLGVSLTEALRSTVVGCVADPDGSVTLVIRGKDEGK